MRLTDSAAPAGNEGASNASPSPAIPKALIPKAFMAPSSFAARPDRTFRRPCRYRSLRLPMQQGTERIVNCLELSTVWLEMPKQRSNGAKPQRRDPVATRKKLLTAARREFAQNRGGARHVRGSSKIEAMHSPLVSMVSKILKQGVRAGTFRKGIDPVHLYISIAGLSYFFFSNTPTLSAIFGKDLASPAAKRTRRKHVVDLVMQALRP